MDRYYEADAIDKAPQLSTLASKGYPTNGNANTATLATQPGAAWFYAVTEEICNAIKALGGTNDKLNVNQLGTILSQSFAKCSKLATDNTFAGTNTFSKQIVANGGIKGNLTGNVTGNVSGSSATATKATQDASGNNIVNTYATKSSLSSAALRYLSHIFISISISSRIRLRSFSVNTLEEPINPINAITAATGLNNATTPPARAR